MLISSLLTAKFTQYACSNLIFACPQQVSHIDRCLLRLYAHWFAFTLTSANAFTVK